MGAEYGIELIAPNRRNGTKTQERESAAPLKRCWNVERLFARFHNFCRLVTRWEHHIENYFGLPASKFC